MPIGIMLHFSPCSKYARHAPKRKTPTVMYRSRCCAYCRRCCRALMRRQSALRTLAQASVGNTHCRFSTPSRDLMRARRQYAAASSQAAIGRAMICCCARHTQPACLLSLTIRKGDTISPLPPERRHCWTLPRLYHESGHIYRALAAYRRHRLTPRRRAFRAHSGSTADAR